MYQEDEIDILFKLNPHGWSTCVLYIMDKTIEFTITNIFGEPIIDLIKALSDLMKGQNKVSFFWFGEPGGEKIEMNRILTEQHKIIFTASGFKEAFGDEPKDFDLTIQFEIKLKQLVTIFYLQLRKIYLLLKDKKFAENRANDFPYQEFRKFELLVFQYFGD